MSSRLQYFGIPLLACVLILAIIPRSVRSLEVWIIYVPSSDDVDLKFWMLNQTGYINVTLDIGYPCVNVSSWGEIVRDNSSLSVSSEIWWWTGFCWCFIAPPILHTYDLGYLEEGLYTFRFMVFGMEVKRIPFAVGFILGDVNRDGRVRIDDILAIALAFGSDYGDPEYEPYLDVNGDLKIRVDDVLIAAENFGRE